MDSRFHQASQNGPLSQNSSRTANFAQVDNFFRACAKSTASTVSSRFHPRTRERPTGFQEPFCSDK